MDMIFGMAIGEYRSHIYLSVLLLQIDYVAIKSKIMKNVEKLCEHTITHYSIVKNNSAKMTLLFLFVFCFYSIKMEDYK